MTAVTLQDVVDQLKVNNVGIANTSENIASLVKSMEQSRLDNYESKLKSSRAKPIVPDTKSGAYQMGEKFTSSIPLLLNPKNLIAPLLASLTAFGAGVAGLRGWEKLALTKMTDSLGNVSANISKGVEGFKSRALLAFGIGADGKPVQARGPGGRFGAVSTSGTFITTATERIRKILAPIRTVSSGIGQFLKGAGAPIMEFLKPFISGASKFTTLFSKILWPVGVIMSLFKSVNAYKEEDGSKFDKFKEGFGTFFADFLGAPLDLLKSGMVWMLRKLLGVEVDEDGNIKPGQGLAGDALAVIQKFSFKESIKSLIDGVFGIGEAAFKWFSDLFSGEKTIGESLAILWKAWLGTAAGIADWVWNKAIKPITEWFAEKLGINLDLPELNIKEMVGNTYERIKNNFMSSMENLAIWFVTMPKKIGLALEEEWVYAVAKLKTGFIEFGSWVAGLPARITLAALESVNNSKAGFLIPDGIVEAQKQKVANAASGTEAALARVDYSTAKQLGDINQRRKDLDTYSQQLMDARQYNTTTVNNSGGFLVDQHMGAGDTSNGGLTFGHVGGR